MGYNIPLIMPVAEYAISHIQEQRATGIALATASFIAPERVGRSKPPSISFMSALINTRLPDVDNQKNTSVYGQSKKSCMKYDAGTTARRLCLENWLEQGEEGKAKRRLENQMEEAKKDHDRKKEEVRKPQEKPKDPINAAIDACIAEKKIQYAGKDFEKGEAIFGFHNDTPLSEALEVVRSRGLQTQATDSYNASRFLAVTGIQVGNEFGEICTVVIMHPDKVRYGEPNGKVHAAPSPR